MEQNHRIVEGELRYIRDGQWVPYSQETLGLMYTYGHIDVGFDGKVSSSIFTEK